MTAVSMLTLFILFFFNFLKGKTAMANTASTENLVFQVFECKQFVFFPPKKDAKSKCILVCLIFSCFGGKKPEKQKYSLFTPNCS